METFPDCKVILSERNEDCWVQSWVKQLELTHALRETTTGIIALSLSQTAREMNHDVVDCCLTALLGSINPKSTCVFKKRYRMHNHRVKSIVPPEKLLAPVVQTLDSAIHRINHYPVDKYYGNQLRYPLDSDLAGG